MSITVAGLDAQLQVVDNVYLGVHSGAPGANGSTNELAGTRPAIAMGTPTTDGTGRKRSNTAVVTFADPGAGTYEAWSLWTAATGGTCVWIVPFAENRVLVAGDDLRAAVGGVNVKSSPAV